MHLPEKTILGIATVTTTFSALGSLRYALGGGAAARMAEHASNMASPEGFRVGFVIGMGLVLLVKWLVALGLLAMLVARFRGPRRDP